MRHILAHANVDVLAQLAWARVLLAFDFDGTLAPIVDDRDGAKMRARTSRLFTKVCSLYPCAVISGRSQKDVASRLEGAQVKYVIGNHGLEPGVGIGAFEEDVAAARVLLGAALAGLAGIDIEDKRYSLAIHYRRARKKREVRDAIHAAVRALPVPMRLIAGKMVVNVVPDRAPNKGDALLHLREQESADTALYVGDDITDEDVFKLDQPGRVLTVRVGASRTSAATYFLRTQGEMDPLLAKLIALREHRGIA
ncbi:MAG: trehalose-phosphatase [Deltaproteobacteria bacterium]|nr:trehalose-phosphatase [Deltaproteobacteria bacterium]